MSRYPQPLQISPDARASSMTCGAPVPTQRIRPSHVVNNKRANSQYVQPQPTSFTATQHSRSYSVGGGAQTNPKGGLKAVESTISRSNTNDMYDDMDDEDLQGLEELPPLQLTLPPNLASSSPNVKIHKPSQAYNHHASPATYSASKKVVAAFAGPPKSISKRGRDSGDEREQGRKKSKKTGSVQNAVVRKASVASMEAPGRSPRVSKDLSKTKQNISRAATQMMRFPEDLEHFEAPALIRADKLATASGRKVEQIIYIDRAASNDDEDEDEGQTLQQVEDLDLSVSRVEKRYYHQEGEKDRDIDIVPDSDDIPAGQVDRLHSDAVDDDPDQTAVEREQEDEGVYVGQQLAVPKIGKQVEQVLPAQKEAHRVLHPECKCTTCFYDPHEATKYDTQTHEEWRAEGLEYINKLTEITQEYMKLMVTRIDAFDVLVKKMDVHMKELDVAKKDAEEKKEAVRSGLPWN